LNGLAGFDLVGSERHPGRRAWEEEFVAYYAARGNILRRTAYLLCGDWHLAEDLTQTTFTNLYRAWPRIERHEVMDQYARQVLLRAFLSQGRRPWRREVATAPGSAELDPTTWPDRGGDEGRVLHRQHGKVTYGYRRIYHQRTKALVRQEPDDEAREATAEDGVVTTYTRAGIVAEIFDRVAAGDPLIVIERDLNARGIPSPEGGASGWLRGIIRKIALNPAYNGQRVLRGEVVGQGSWPALVGEETYWACRRLLEDPARTTTRPARARYLLSYIARCGECGGPLSSQSVHRHGWQGLTYRCLKRQCCAVKMDYLDEYVERIVVAWLSTTDVHEALHQPTSDREASQARAEAQRLRGDLEDYKKLAEAGELKPVDYVRFERGLSRQIAEAEARAQQADLPAVLRGRIGAHAADEWAKLAGTVAVKREIIRLVLSIELLRTTPDDRTFGPHRVRLAWTYGETAPTANASTAAGHESNSSAGRVAVWRSRARNRSRAGTLGRRSETQCAKGGSS
jgi:DNA-directed RNA polymerase specialized sigma24 family protein